MIGKRFERLGSFVQGLHQIFPLFLVFFLEEFRGFLLNMLVIFGRLTRQHALLGHLTMRFLLSVR